MERGLQVEVVWKDNDIVEVRVSTWNGAFGGIADIYLNYGELSDLARSFEGFPRAPRDDRQGKLGDPDTEAGGAIFYLSTTDSAGHAAIRMRLQTGLQQGADQTVTLRAVIEAAGIDDFVAELRKMNDEIGQKAFLRFNLF